MLQVLSLGDGRGHLLAKIAGRTPKMEQIALETARGRVLAQDIVSKTDLPDFTRSSVDGWAVVAADTFGVVTRGIAGNTMLTDPLAEPIAAEYVKFPAKDSVACLVPSELWVIVHSPYASFSVLALSVRIIRY